MAVNIVAARLGRILCLVKRFTRKLLGKDVNHFCYWFCKYRIWEVDSRDFLKLYSLFGGLLNTLTKTRTDENKSFHLKEHSHG